jgi:hypothetical protein
MFVPYTVVYRRIDAVARAMAVARHAEEFAAGLPPTSGPLTAIPYSLPADAFPFNR